VQHWVRSKPAVWFGLVAGVLVILAIVFLPPSLHEVHMAGATPVKVTAFDSDETVSWRRSAPSQSLAGVNCLLVVGHNIPCEADKLSNHFPKLTQDLQVLYVVWRHCAWSENGNHVTSQGFNLDFLPATRTLVIHCYAATPWLLLPPKAHGIAPSPPVTLLVVNTASIGAGSINVREEDRLEYLLGDQSTEFQVATAMIS
jgi:hypothetical protein